jgi:hypothetical protein
MPPDPDELNRLQAEGQYFFLPYYREVVDQHPDGIPAADVKELVAQQLLERFEIDIFNPAQTGTHIRGTTRASQWANNLVSNEVLDGYMLVVRSTRAILYPGATDNSRVSPRPGDELTDGQVAELDERTPTQITTQAGSTYRRSLQLAEHVRELSGRSCAAARPTCAVFDARDGRPYVEVHHIIPMAIQGTSSVNLDRSTNMTPLCARCHTCLHRGRTDLASDILDELLGWFESVHGRSFGAANVGVGLDTTSAGLLEMYGSMPD